MTKNFSELKKIMGSRTEEIESLVKIFMSLQL